MWANGVLPSTQQDLGASNQTFGMETTAPALYLRKYWQMRSGSHYYYCYWWCYYFCCWHHDCCCQPYGSKLEAFRGQCWAVYRRDQSPCHACASTSRNAAHMHYKVSLPHLARASTRAFPECYMNDTFLAGSHDFACDTSIWAGRVLHSGQQLWHASYE